jgi:S-formylglutathione hydrolase FrmB
MALLHVDYFSQALAKMHQLVVVLPDGVGPFPVVYQLHGLSDNHTAWQRRTSIERYADARGLMVVMPDGGRSFYTDAKQMPGQYEQAMLEVVRFTDRTFRTVAERDGRAVGGLSMGGYGSMKLGLKYPELFGSVASHSGALDMDRRVKDPNWAEIRLIFGDTLDPADDLFALAANSANLPALYFDCGTEDFLLDDNRKFRAHLAQVGVTHTYEEFPGDHNWEFWDAHVPAALDFHVAHLAACQVK